MNSIIDKDCIVPCAACKKDLKLSNSIAVGISHVCEQCHDDYNFPIDAAGVELLNHRQALILLGRVVYNMRAKHVVWKDQTYCQHQTLWSDTDPTPDPNACDGYFDCTPYWLERDDRPVVDAAEVTIECTIDPDKIFSATCGPFEEECHWQEGIFDGLSDKVLILPGDVTVLNEMGENDDHRGSDHLDIILPMKYEVIIPKGIVDIEAIASELCKLKSHHFENNYEAFWYMNSCNDDDDDDWVMSISGDHGS